MLLEVKENEQVKGALAVDTADKRISDCRDLQHYDRREKVLNGSTRKTCEDRSILIPSWA